MFDLEKFDIKLNTDVIGRNFIYAEEVTSTNSQMLIKNKLYNKHGSVLLTEQQTAGRGRQNRIWYSTGEMNLTFSILLTEPKYFKYSNMINYATSLAIALSIENLYQLRTELKWPNDVLINKKKIAGILTESVSTGSSISRMVIGIGLNVNQVSFQGKFMTEPTSLKKELGYIVEREKTLAEILNNLEEQFEALHSPYNRIMEEWKSKCNMIGERITVMNGIETKHGIFSDIDKNGFLVLRTDDKLETLSSGDVSIV